MERLGGAQLAVTIIFSRQIGDLIMLATFECMNFFGRREDGHVNLPYKELTIERLVPIENPQARSESRPSVIATNGVTSILVSKEQIPDPADAIRSNWVEISALPNVSRLLSTLRDCGPGPINFGSGKPPEGMTHLENYCVMAVSDAITRVETGKELTDWSYASGERLLQAQANPRQLCTIVAPLVNFYVESIKSVSITDRLRIRSTTEDEIEQFGIKGSIIGYALTKVGGPSRFRPVRWVVETSFTDTPNDGTAAQHALRELDGVVTALRILGDQFFDYPVAAVTYQPYTHPSYGQANPRAPAFHHWSQLDGPFLLDASIIPSATRFVRTLLPIMMGVTNKEIKISVSKLRQASTRENDTDMVIDGIVALEAVLLRRHEKDRSFRLASRTALLIGDKPEERKRIYEFVSHLNVIRGDVLHGREEFAQRTTAGEVLSLSRRVVRQVVEDSTIRPLEALIIDLDRRIDDLSMNGIDPLGRVFASRRTVRRNIV